MLFQPTNIIPDSISGLSNGVVNASDKISVSWQMQGNSPMTAFQIVIIDPNISEQTVFDTGKVTLAESVYPSDSKGNPTVYTYNSEDRTWRSIGSYDGCYLSITQFWTESGVERSVTQYSPSVFRVREEPTVSVLYNGTQISQRSEAPSVVTSALATFSGNFSQANGDTVSWARWQLFSNNPLEQKALDDTGVIYTQSLSYTFNGFLDGSSYVLKLSLKTSSGVEVTVTGYLTATYTSTLINPKLLSAKVQLDSGVLLQWANALSIPGEVSGTVSYNTDGINVSKNSEVTWNKVTSTSQEQEQPLSIEPPYVFSIKQTVAPFYMSNGVKNFTGTANKPFRFVNGNNGYTYYLRFLSSGNVNLGFINVDASAGFEPYGWQGSDVPSDIAYLTFSGKNYLIVMFDTNLEFYELEDEETMRKVAEISGQFTPAETSINTAITVYDENLYVATQQINYGLLPEVFNLHILSISDQVAYETVVSSSFGSYSEDKITKLSVWKNEYVVAELESTNNRSLDVVLLTVAGLTQQVLRAFDTSYIPYRQTIIGEERIVCLHGFKIHLFEEYSGSISESIHTAFSDITFLYGAVSPVNNSYLLVLIEYETHERAVCFFHLESFTLLRKKTYGTAATGFIGFWSNGNTILVGENNASNSTSSIKFWLWYPETPVEAVGSVSIAGGTMYQYGGFEVVWRGAEILFPNMGNYPNKGYYSNDVASIVFSVQVMSGDAFAKITTVDENGSVLGTTDLRSTSGTVISSVKLSGTTYSGPRSYGTVSTRYINIFSLTDEQVADEYLYTYSDDPVWNDQTEFYATFYNSTEAGSANIVTQNSGFALYKRYPGEQRQEPIYTYTGEEPVTRLKDYGLPSNSPYKYTMFFIDDENNYSNPSATTLVCAQFPFYTLIEATRDSNDPNVYHALNVWNFKNNFNGSDTISNNNNPTWLENFTKYRLRQPSHREGRSGTLSALIGRVYYAKDCGGYDDAVTYYPLNYIVDENQTYFAKRKSVGIKPGVALDWEYYWSACEVPTQKYIDTVAESEKLFNISASQNTFFLKDLKGNLYMVGIASPVSQTINNGVSLEVSVSISWEEVGDAKNVSIIQLPTDEGWEET